MQDTLLMVLQAVLAVAVPVVTGFAIRFLNVKADAAKGAVKNETAERYITEAADAVTTAVAFVSQTYTDALKKSGAFTVANQREAFDRARRHVVALLSSEAYRFINNTYVGAEDYLAKKIEAEIKLQK